MQQPTHPRLHVRDAHDAHVVFEAVRQGFLPLIVRRLNDTERSVLVRPGAIFVWTECDDDAGLKRWTDGRIWGQSRMREPYLFYDEKLSFDMAPSDSGNRSQTFRFVDSAPRNGPTSSALSHQDRTNLQHPGLVKQAYSAWVSSNVRTRPQKWHLTGYFTYSELAMLPTIDQDPLLQRIIVPSGIYRSGSSRSRSGEVELLARRNSASSGYREERTPLLPSIQQTVPEIEDYATSPQSTARRLSEDQRVIRMLDAKLLL